MEQAKLFLNDFRWSEKLISQQDPLKLLEGDALHIAAPKTHFLIDIVIYNDTPIFATSISWIRSYLNENFQLLQPVSTTRDKRASICPKCFADFVFEK